MSKNIICRADCKQSVEQLLEFLLTEYYVIFGRKCMEKELCIIYNDSFASCPMLVLNRNPIHIRLAQENMDFWVQTVFQLSHELCHYALRQGKTEKSHTLKWFEEIVCEAMSLYALEYCAKSWSRCLLSRRNSQFYKSFEIYLADRLNEKGTDVFQYHVKANLLSEYEKIAESDRISHRNERNVLYKAISQKPSEMQYFCNYQNYLIEPDKFKIDFDRWLLDTPCDLIETMKKLSTVETAVLV